MTTYSLDDIGLIPSTISNIEHRSECNPYNSDNMFPIFTAPMNAVINETNYQEFLNYKINTVIPRGVDFKVRCNLATKTFVAFSLQECASFASLMQYEKTDDIYYVCIDVAQGAMSRLLSLVQKLKEIFGYRIIIMTGNIANPETYFEYAKVGVDFIRCSVGSGSCCTTGKNLGVYYGMASLLKEVRQYKSMVQTNIRECDEVGIISSYKSIPIIIADGGFDTTDKILKALVLGADYVMVGKQFAQCQEACGETIMKTINIEEIITTKIDDAKSIHKVVNTPMDVLHRIYYGMSTIRAQKETGRENIRTAEGIETLVPVTTNLKVWTAELKDNLQSLMSYANVRELVDLTKIKHCIKYVRR